MQNSWVSIKCIPHSVLLFLYEVITPNDIILELNICVPFLSANFVTVITLQLACIVCLKFWSSWQHLWLCRHSSSTIFHYSPLQRKAPPLLPRTMAPLPVSKIIKNICMIGNVTKPHISDWCNYNLFCKKKKIYIYICMYILFLKYCSLHPLKHSLMKQ